MPRKKKPQIINRQKSTQGWWPLFLDFIGNMQITSKEIDADKAVPLLDVMYGAQHRFLEEICTGLDRGIHDFTCLKARQLGISTICLPIDIFWLSIHERMHGALVIDDEGNKEKFRILIEQYITSLPKGLRVGIRKNNRNNLVLENGSVLDYLVAGRKRGNASLGQSRGLTFLHATEVSSYGSEDGWASLTAALAQKHPHRLFIKESTAKGFNMFWETWQEAKADELSQKAFFIGWWAKEDYCFAEGTPEFEKYWDGTMTPVEIAKCEGVLHKYGVTITPGQVAWYRWFSTAKMSSEDLMAQNYPWDEDEAFIMSGRSFFPLKRVAEDIRFIEESEAPFKGYRYHMGSEFLATEVEQVSRPQDAELRVWEEPHPNGVYVMGVDTAYGRSDDANNHAIEIFRCYADKMVQVCEWATNIPETYQAAWAMCHLAGAYGRAAGSMMPMVWINLEISGPGFAIMRELQHLRQLLDAGHLAAAAAERGMTDIFQSVRWYLYHKPDIMGPGYVYNWKTNADNKLTIMNQLRDNYSTRMLRLRSIPLLEEMKIMVQDQGSDIRAEGRNNDDRVFASALANKTWVDWVRPSMIANNQMYDYVTDRERAQNEAPQSTMVGRVVEDFFKMQESDREERLDREAWGLDR